MAWKNININKLNIIAQTERSVLIACPHKSDYDGYSFWHPAKLVRSGRNSFSVSIGYTDDFTFRLKKYGKGRHNSHDIIDEKEITSEEFEDMFAVSNANITERKEKDLFETHKPTEHEATESLTEKDLEDND